MKRLTCFGWLLPTSCALTSLTADYKIVGVGTFRPVCVAIDDLVGSVTILEASASAQEALVELALRELDEAACAPGADDPYGAVLWPASLAVSRAVARDDAMARCAVLELGAGTGLCALAAAAVGAREVLATDFRALPLDLIAEAARRHGFAQVHTRLLDLCEAAAPLPRARGGAFFELVLAADVMYEPATGVALARRVAEAYALGARVLVGDSPGRAGRPAFLEELRRLRPDLNAAFVDVAGHTVTGDRHDLICGAGSTSVSTSGRPEPHTIALLDLEPPGWRARVCAAAPRVDRAAR